MPFQLSYYSWTIHPYIRTSFCSKVCRSQYLDIIQIAMEGVCGAMVLQLTPSCCSSNTSYNWHRSKCTKIISDKKSTKLCGCGDIETTGAKESGSETVEKTSIKNMENIGIVEGSRHRYHWPWKKLFKIIHSFTSVGDRCLHRMISWYDIHNIYK